MEGNRQHVGIQKCDAICVRTHVRVNSDNMHNCSAVYVEKLKNVPES